MVRCDAEWVAVDPLSTLAATARATHTTADPSRAAAPPVSMSGRRRLREVADAVAASLERARQRRHLQNLDDHGLRDIGLTRAEAETAWRKPFWIA